MTDHRRPIVSNRLVGVLLIVMGLALVGQNRYFAAENSETGRCLTDQVQALTQVIEDRGSVNRRNNELIDAFILEVVESVATEDEDKFSRAIKDYPGDRAALEREREKAKVPPFPTGKCDS